MNSDFERFWSETVTWDAWLAGVDQKADLWTSYAKRARVAEADRDRLLALGRARRIMVLTEDWCGDAIRSIPSIAALSDVADDVEMRVLDVEKHPAALDGRLTRGARAIPVVVVFDGDGNEIGSWGPRPSPLQAELRAKIASEGAPARRFSPCPSHTTP